MAVRSGAAEWDETHLDEPCGYGLGGVIDVLTVGVEVVLRLEDTHKPALRLIQLRGRRWQIEDAVEQLVTPMVTDSSVKPSGLPYVDDDAVLDQEVDAGRRRGLDAAPRAHPRKASSPTEWGTHRGESVLFRWENSGKRTVGCNPQHFVG